MIFHNQNDKKTNNKDKRRFHAREHLSKETPLSHYFSVLTSRAITIVIIVDARKTPAINTVVNIFNSLLHRHYYVYRSILSLKFREYM